MLETTVHIEADATDADAQAQLESLFAHADFLLREIRTNSRRHIAPAEWKEAGSIVTSKPYGMHMMHGGTKASQYPATTSVVLLSWFTRLSGVKVVRVSLTAHRLYSASQPVFRDCVGESMLALQDEAGPLQASSFLREVWEFADVPTGDADIDPLAEAIRETPANMDAWQAYADAIRFESNGKAPNAPASIADMIQQRIA